MITATSFLSFTHRSGGGVDVTIPEVSGEESAAGTYPLYVGRLGEGSAVCVGARKLLTASHVYDGVFYLDNDTVNASHRYNVVSTIHVDTLYGDLRVCTVDRDFPGYHDIDYDNPTTAGDLLVVAGTGVGGVIGEPGFGLIPSRALRAGLRLADGAASVGFENVAAVLPGLVVNEAAAVDKDSGGGVFKIIDGALKWVQGTTTPLAYYAQMWIQEMLGDAGSAAVQLATFIDDQRAGNKRVRLSFGRASGTYTSTAAKVRAKWNGTTYGNVSGAPETFVSLPSYVEYTMEAIASESIAEDCLALDSGVFTPAAGFSANSAIADLPLVLEEVAPVSVPALVGGGSNADSVTVTLPQQSNTSGTASGSMSSTWDINVSGTGGGVAKFKTPCGTEMLSSPSAVTDAVIAGSTWTPNSGDAVTSLAGRVQIDAEYTYDESETDPNVKYDNVLAGYTTVSTGITITSNTGTSASTAIRPQFSGFRKFTATRTGRVRFDLSAGTMTDYKLAVCSAAGGYLESVGTNETYSTNGAHIGNITSGQEYILEVRNDHSTGTSQTATFRVTEFLVGLPPQISRDDGDAPVSVGTEVPYTIDNVVGSVGTDYIYVQDITNGDLTIDGNPVSVGDYIAISTALGATFTPSGSGASFTLGGSVGNSSDGIGLSETFTTATLDIQSQGRGRGNRGRGRGPMVWGPSR